ncbi:hypothetical protein Ddc_17638 [Ditylenchus destructor]|nr:hypothetical protein Ddc_17638 [Ditylenchus destructor]
MFVSTASFLFIIVALLVKDAKASIRDVEVSLILDGSDDTPVVESVKILIGEHSVRSIVEKANTKVTKSEYWTDGNKYEFSHAVPSYAKTTNPNEAVKLPSINNLDAKDNAKDIVHVQVNNVKYKLAVHMKKK